MTKEANGSNGAEATPRIGQRFKRADQSGMIFVVTEEVRGFGLPHFRVRRIDDPTDTRIFAFSALLDRHLFRAVQGNDLPEPSDAGQLRLSA